MENPEGKGSGILDSEPDKAEFRRKEDRPQLRCIEGDFSPTSANPEDGHPAIWFTILRPEPTVEPPPSTIHFATHTFFSVMLKNLAENRWREAADRH